MKFQDRRETAKGFFTIFNIFACLVKFLRQHFTWKGSKNGAIHNSETRAGDCEVNCVGPPSPLWRSTSPFIVFL